MNPNDHSVTLTGSPEVILLLKNLLSLKIADTVAQSVDDATVDASNAQPTPVDASNAQPTPVRVDQKGVPFDPTYCTSSKESPFLKTPKAKAGQWRKRRGLDATIFDQWYQNELLRVQNVTPQPDTTPTLETPPVNTAAAFGGNPIVTPEIKDGGALMQWISDMQAQSKLTVQDLTTAFASERLEVRDVFDPTPKAQIEINVARIFATLQKMVRQ